MRITNLEIHNFRGIRESYISFPIDTRIICLIGAGDSTKSTLLKAIEWAFWPTRNLTAGDSDFFQGNISDPIIIRVTCTEFSDKLLAEDKFGLYQRKPNVVLDGASDDEPSDDLPYCLTVQLTIDSTLEPKWEIVCNRQEPRSISNNDRKLMFVGAIGNNISRDMVWGKNSVLQKYADSKGVLHEAYTAAVRDVAKNADLSALNGISETLSEIGKKYGVNFAAEIKNRLLLQGTGFSSTIGLFDGDTPLSQYGTGSQRLLSMGLNIDATAGDALLLIDEIENGLEPYRLRNLINEFRSEHNTAGQIIMTTHSPVVVAECTIDEIMVVHSSSGVTYAKKLKGNDLEANKAMQAQIRKNAEAFLSKRLIICEGKTEMGFIRAADSYIASTKDYRMAHKGVGTADGNGSDIFKCADILRDCGYDICILMDSDKDSEDAEKERMRSDGIPVFDWDRPNAFEEQCFTEITLDAIHAEIRIAIDEKSADSVAAKLTNAGLQFVRDGDSITFPSLSTEQRKMLGKIAKNCSWYKRIGLGEQFGNIVMSCMDSFGDKSVIKRNVNGLAEWVINDDETRT